MKKAENHMTIYAVPHGEQGGFSVWLDYSGQKEFVADHRCSPALFQMLSGGISLGKLRRSCGNFCHLGAKVYRHTERAVRRNESALNKSVSRLCQRIDRVLAEMEDSRDGLAAEMEAVSA